MPKLKTQLYWCAAEGCNADDRKRGKYGFMDSVEFFSLTTKSQREEKVVRLAAEKGLRLCSLHFVDGRPTSAHPYPELFAYNNFKQTENVRGTSSIMRRCPQEYSSSHSTTDSCQQMEQLSSNIQVLFLSYVKLSLNRCKCLQ